MEIAIGEAAAGSVVTMSAVSKSYGQTTAVSSLDLTLQQGKTVALLGPNGAGKSTIVALMLGLAIPDSGRVSVTGRSPTRAVADGRIAGMLQDAGFMPGVRVGELVRLGEEIYPRPIRTVDALRLAGLTQVARQRVDRLSGGQAQRLRFALAIVANPDVLLLDEPTRALDVQGRAEFWDAIRAYAGAGRTVLFATHYLDEVEGNADRVIVLAAGRVVADGTAEEVRGCAGVSTVRFQVGLDPVGELEAELARLVEQDGGSVVAVHGSLVSITTRDADAVVRRLAASRIRWRGIEVAGSDWSQSYLALTGTASGAIARQEEP